MANEPPVYLSIGMAFSCQRAISTHPCVHLSRFIALPPERPRKKDRLQDCLAVHKFRVKLNTWEWRDQDPDHPSQVFDLALIDPFTIGVFT